MELDEQQEEYMDPSMGEGEMEVKLYSHNCHRYTNTLSVIFDSVLIKHCAIKNTSK